MLKRIVLLFALILMLTPTLSAWMQDDQVTPEATVEINTDDWEPLEGRGVRLLAPSTWFTFDADTEDLASMLEDVNSDADINAMIEAMGSMGDAYLLFAYNLTFDTTFGTNLNVIGLDVGTRIPMSFAVDVNVGALSDMVSDVEGTVIELNNEEVGYITLALEVNEVPIRQAQYYFMRGTMMYVITFAAAADKFEKLMPEFEAIASTFELIED